jgi:hypothetical protein
MLAQLADERDIIIIHQNERIPLLSSHALFGLFGPKAHCPVRSAGSVTFNHSTVCRDLLEAFLELYFFEQKIGDQATETRILDPQLPDLACCFAIIRSLRPPSVSCAQHRWASSRVASLSPAVVRHDADSQRPGDIAMQHALGRHPISRSQLGGDFRSCVSMSRHLRPHPSSADISTFPTHDRLTNINSREHNHATLKFGRSGLQGARIVAEKSKLMTQW